MANSENSNKAPIPKPNTVLTNSLRPNPHNPRRLFDKAPLKVLEESIRRVGILVPLTVYKASGSDQYTILDGQRRWICAQNIELETVPINEVHEPDVAENIVTMFQIHKLRKDWELMPTALKLGVLIEELDKKSTQKVTDTQLAVITGLDNAVVTRCKKLLTFDSKYQEMMLFSEPEDRIKADFFIELYPILHDQILRRSKLNQHYIIDRMLFKYQNRKSGFKSITDFRKIKSAVSVAKAVGKQLEIVQKYRDFVENDEFLIEDLEINSSDVYKSAKSITKQLVKISAEIQSIDVSEFLGQEDFWIKLEELRDLIIQRLNDADRRF